MKPKYASSLLAAAALSILPFVASAQTQSTGLIGNLFSFALNIINDYVVPLIFAVAFVIFLFRVYQLFIQGGSNEESVQNGRKFVMWSMVGFFLMFSVWGLINLLINTLGFDSSSMPAIPTFLNSSSGSGSLGGFGSLLGGSSGGTTSGSGLESYLAPTDGTGCLSGYVLSGSYCVPANSGSTSMGATAAAGTPGGGCTNDDQCNDVNGQSYGCYKTNGSSSGICTVDGDAPADGTVAPGGACTNDNSCQDTNGQSYGCNNGTCTVDGDAAADGTVAPGGACTNDNSCQDTNGQSYGCNNGTCTLDGDGSIQGDGTVQPGGNCSTDSNCADANGQSYGCFQGTCTVDGDAPADGSVAQGGSCAGNENACASGTCDSDGICADEDSGNSTSGGVTQCDVGSVSGGANCVLCSDGSTTADSAADCPGGGYTGDDNGGDANDNAINSDQDTGSDNGDDGDGGN
jgi:hypothetical protein